MESQVNEIVTMSILTIGAFRIGHHLSNNHCGIKIRLNKPSRKQMDLVQVHKATSLGLVKEEIVVKLCDIPRNDYEQCRQVRLCHS